MSETYMGREFIKATRAFLFAGCLMFWGGTITLFIGTWADVLALFGVQALFWGIAVLCYIASEVADQEKEDVNGVD